MQIICTDFIISICFYVNRLIAQKVFNLPQQQTLNATLSLCCCFPLRFLPTHFISLQSCFFCIFLNNLITHKLHMTCTHGYVAQYAFSHFSHFTQSFLFPGNWSCLRQPIFFRCLSDTPVMFTPMCEHAWGFIRFIRKTVTSYINIL